MYPGGGGGTIVCSSLCLDHHCRVVLVLGPLLFILYSNDIPNSLTYCQAILFADDTTVYLTGDNLQTMHDKVNTDLYTLNDWFRANQLSVNPSKTKYILFSKYGNVLTNGFCILIMNISNEYKLLNFLGFILMNTLLGNTI